MSRAALRLRQLARQPIARLLSRIPAAPLEALLTAAITQRARSLAPADGLRFLFGLEAALYPLQGILAIAYDGGVHTKHRHTRYHDFFISRVQPNDRVLDIGCGSGALAYDLAAKAGAHVVGIDLSEANIALATRRYGHSQVRYLVGDAVRALPRTHFDVVVLSNVLEHIEERPAFLRRVQAAMRPNRILIRVPLFERDWRVPLKRELGIEWRLDPTHETEYTLESFAIEIAAARLSIVHQEVRWGELWAESAHHAP